MSAAPFYSCGRTGPTGGLNGGAHTPPTPLSGMVHAVCAFVATMHPVQIITTRRALICALETKRANLRVVAGYHQAALDALLTEQERDKAAAEQEIAAIEGALAAVSAMPIATAE